MSTLHTPYHGIIARCEDRNTKLFPLYGGRGIKMSRVWRNDFNAFLVDMGRRPSAEHSVERLDPNGDYEAGNCKWATDLEQARNRRNTRFVIYRGTRMSLTAAADLAGNVIHPQSAWNRIVRSGWAVDKALETPSTRFDASRAARPATGGSSAKLANA